MKAAALAAGHQLLEALTDGELLLVDLGVVAAAPGYLEEQDRAQLLVRQLTVDRLLGPGVPELTRGFVGSQDHLTPFALEHVNPRQLLSIAILLLLQLAVSVARIPLEFAVIEPFDTRPAGI